MVAIAVAISWASRFVIATALLTCGCATPRDAQPDSRTVAVDAADTAATTTVTPADYDKAGPFGVGLAQLQAKDNARDRTVQLTLWYPATTQGAATHLPAAYGDVPKLADLYAAATPTCVRATTTAAADLAPVAGSWPIVVFSHCSGCFRSSSAALAERLASHGIAVIAADHTPNTLYDIWNGTVANLSPEVLQTRVDDVRFALDVATSATATALPVALRGHCDGSRAGVFGHSFGALTTGAALAADPRFKAGLAIAAPLSSPYPPGPDVATLLQPLLLILAKEDNSITEIGNQFIRDNYAAAKGPAWLLEVADAGHFSFSDIAGLLPSFHAGCGTDKRQTDGKPFAYLAPDQGRALASRVVAAFFARYLLIRADALQALDLPFAASVTVQHKP